MTTIKKSMYERTYPNQLEQAKATVSLLLRTPIQDRDFLIGIQTLEDIIDMAQNPGASGDGSINEETWGKLSAFLKACRTINIEICQTSRWLGGIKKPLAIRVGTCPVCSEPQFQTPSGPSCKNGHGGA